ncbi:MAG: TetR/AcrR family transcriptional regulator [Gemmatimonadetes bacterium]|nr:TetR/AcrR family transcriptional regulator [Gemmatimonadota bacterium]
MVMPSYDERLDRLLTTAARVFADKGYHPTTMRDLARATGMSLAGMYHYVGGKDELLFLIQQRCFTRVLSGAETAVSQSTEPRQRLERFIRHHVTFFAGHMSEMKVLSHEAESLQGERLGTINALKRRYVALLTNLVQSADGALESGIDPHVASYALFGMMNWIYNWYDPTGPVSPETLSEQFSRLFLSGLATDLNAQVSPGG